MLDSSILDDLLKARSSSQVESILKTLENKYKDRIQYVPVGGIEHSNNCGQIQIGVDPGKAIIERLTNAIDAIIELEYYQHDGLPICKTPKDAASAWLNVPPKGLYQLSSTKRAKLADRIQLVIQPTDNHYRRNVTIMDKGIGIPPERMTKTILSLGSNNKLEKPYLMGAYGQGGSSAFAWCKKYSVICSKSNLNNLNEQISFTIVFFEDLDPDKYKLGRYVYLTLDGDLLHTDSSSELGDYGTIVKHFDYDLTSYKASLGPNSVYGLLQRALFDPVMPIKLDDQVHNYRRVIKGARNAFNASVDEDIHERGPTLSYSMPIYSITIASYGSIRLEYWVLQESQSNKKYDPIKAFVDDRKPILFTLNGQTHAEFSGSLIRSDADLPFLRNRIVIHVDCNGLNSHAKRNLFSSTREDIRKNEISKIIIDEIVKSLKSDDRLRSLNEEAKNSTIRAGDEDSDRAIQQEVVKLLRNYNFSTMFNKNGLINLDVPGVIGTGDDAVHPPPEPPIKIELKDPPTYVKIVNMSPSKFYPGQRRYIKVETDAASEYHNPDDLKSSKFNVIINGYDIKVSGTTPLIDGRMRLILDCSPDASLGRDGNCIIELHRFGLPTLSDTIDYNIVEKPVKIDSKKVTVPPIRMQQVNGLEDNIWDKLGWSHDITKVASDSTMSEGILTVYYSTVFPPFKQQYERILKQKSTLAKTFLKQYEILIALHSFLLEDLDKENIDADAEDLEKWESEERNRIAVLSCISAEQFVNGAIVLPEVE